MITFFVAGVPVPKGSAKAFMRKGMRFPVVVQDNADKQKPWASSIGYMAMQNIRTERAFYGPTEIVLAFYMPRPKGHYGTGRNAGTLKHDAPLWPTTKPDLDKLIRCVKDALTKIAWNDDSQVASVRAFKMYASHDQPVGCKISIGPLSAPEVGS